MLFDTHAHLDDDRFNSDRDTLIKSMPNEGISLVMNACAEPKDTKNIIKLIDKYPFIYGSVGTHPHYAEAMNDDIIADFIKVAKHDKIKAVGEIGLDYYYDNSPRDTQKYWFKKQMDMAHTLNMPVIIHDRDAHEDTLKILKDKKVEKIGGVLHCFSGSVDMAREVLNMGMYISIAGPVTFKNSKKLVEVVKFVPLDKLLIETDAPYLTPEPFRGERNNPCLVRYTAEKIALIKDIDLAELAKITLENGKKLFDIKQ